MLDLTRLPFSVLASLKQQSMAPTWALNSSGQRVVEAKVETKKRLGRSPDGLDSMNLAYCTPPERDPIALGDSGRGSEDDRDQERERENSRDPRRMSTREGRR